MMTRLAGFPAIKTLEDFDFAFAAGVKKGQIDELAGLGFVERHENVVLVGPSGVNVEFQMRTDEMHVIAEAGVAAHWLYKAQDGEGTAAERLGTKWLQSLLDIQNETRDAAEFWDHVKVDLFPDAVYVFTPKSQIMALPRGATVVDFAYAIHSNVGDRTTAAKINNEQVPLRTELKNGDVVEIITAPVSTPNPAWLGFVRTGRARSKIRHYLKTLAQTESEGLGEKLLTQAIRAEGLEQLPPVNAETQPLWDKLLRFTGNRTRSELMTDLGLGKRIASIVAKRLVVLMTEHGHKPDALLGRTKSGTLSLREDSKGLRFELKLPDTQHGRDLIALAERGDLGGMSFGFIATDEKWTGNKRELRAVDLREISVVQSWPAYQQTEIQLRHHQQCFVDLNALWMETL